MYFSSSEGKKYVYDILLMTTVIILKTKRKRPVRMSWFVVRQKAHHDRLTMTFGENHCFQDTIKLDSGINSLAGIQVKHLKIFTTGLGDFHH